MELTPFFKSIIEEDKSEVVICDTEHKIIYMNPAACINTSKWGGAALLGQSLLNCHNARSQEIIQKVVDWFREDKSHNRIYNYYSEKQNKDVYMIALRDEQGDLIGYYEKHEYRDRETVEPYRFDEEGIKCTRK